MELEEVVAVVQGLAAWNDGGGLAVVLGVKASG